jgi:hypothetical protein
MSRGEMGADQGMGNRGGAQRGNAGAVCAAAKPVAAETGIRAVEAVGMKADRREAIMDGAKGPDVGEAAASTPAAPVATGMAIIGPMA